MTGEERRLYARAEAKGDQLKKRIAELIEWVDLAVDAIALGHAEEAEDHLADLACAAEVLKRDVSAWRQTYERS